MPTTPVMPMSTSAASIRTGTPATTSSPTATTTYTSAVPRSGCRRISPMGTANIVIATTTSLRRISSTTLPR